MNITRIFLSVLLLQTFATLYASKESHASVSAATTTNITLSGMQTIDGVSLSANDRVLLTGQTNPMQNGLWLVRAGHWSRPADFSHGSKVGTVSISVMSGEAHRGTSWMSDTPKAIIGKDVITFSKTAEEN